MEFFIYGMMFLLIILSFVNIKGNGLFKLLRITKELEKAVEKKICGEQRAEIIEKLKNNHEDFAPSLFKNQTLQYQLKLYQTRYQQISAGTEGECNCDIEDYLNLAFLEQIGRKSFCDHTAGGLTAMGVLGTFIGLIAGLNGFDTQNSDTITNGISGLLSGMSLAFNTSVVGIISSLLFGIIYKSLFNRSEYALYMFLETFRINIDNSHNEDTMNDIASGLTMVSQKESDILQKLDRLCELSEYRDGDVMKSLADGYVTVITESIKSQMNDFSKAIDNFNSGTNQQVELLKENTHLLTLLKNQMKTVCANMQKLSNDYNIVIQSIHQVNDSFKNELSDIHAIVDKDISLMKKRDQYSDKIFEKYQNVMNVSQNHVDQANASLQQISTVVYQTTSSISQQTEQTLAHLGQYASQAVADLSHTSQTAIDNMTNNSSVQMNAVCQQTSDFTVFMNESIDNYFQATTEYLDTVFKLIEEEKVPGKTFAKLEELTYINQAILNNMSQLQGRLSLNKQPSANNAKDDRSIQQLLSVNDQMLYSLNRMHEAMLTQNQMMNRIIDNLPRKKKGLFGLRR